MSPGDDQEGHDPQRQDPNPGWPTPPPLGGLPAALGPGSLIGGYRIDAVAGAGGMGTVYRATQLGLGRTVALKVIAPQFAADPTFQDRFRQESQLAASLDHPNVVTVYEAGQDAGHLFVSMRFVAGSDLRALLQREGPLRPDRVVALVAQVAAALDAAHAAGLVHRDVKPANILIEQRGGAEHAYLTDFGLVKRIGVDPELTGSAGWVGSVNYVAPEQVKGGAVDARTDIYALAAVLYTALTGEVPYPRSDIAATLYASVNEAVPSLRARRPDLPVELDAVVARATAKDPAQRYRSAGELVAAVHHALASPSRPMAAPAPTGSLLDAAAVAGPTPMTSQAAWPAPVSPVRPRRRRWAAAALVAAGLVVAGVVGVALASGGGHSSGKPLVANRAGLGGHSAPGGASGRLSGSGGQPGLASPPRAGGSRTFNVAAADASGGLDEFRFTIYDLRRTGPFVTLDVGIVCQSLQHRSGSECQSTDFEGSPFLTKNAATALATIAGIRLIDPVNAKGYDVVRDSQGRAFASRLNSLNVGPTISQAWAKYPAPPSSVSSMDLLFPDGGPTEVGVPITNGGPPSPSGKLSAATPSPFDRPPDSTDANGLTLPVNDLTSSVGNPTASTSQSAQQTTVTLAADVLFDFGSAGLTPAAQNVLATQAAKIKSSATGTVTVTGYTDSIGSDSVNIPLSLARAQAVLAALTPGTAGAPVTFVATGKGSADPVAPNSNSDGSDNPHGRALNRRVTITYTVAGKPAPPPPAPTPPPASAPKGPQTVAYRAGNEDRTDTLSVTADSITRTGRYVVADLTLTCTGATLIGTSTYCDGTSDFAAESDTVPPLGAQGSNSETPPNEQTLGDGIYLTDSTGVVYDSVRTSTGAALTGDLPYDLMVGETHTMWLLFPAMPASATTVTINLPNDAAQITGVAIAAGT